MLARLSVALVVTLLCSSSALADLYDPVVNIQNAPVPLKEGKPLGPADVRDAILAAGTAKQWRVDYLGAGRLSGRLKVRDKHVLDVDIPYSPQHYSILYRDSVNMSYSAADNTIHPNYNRWVRELSVAIDAALRKTAGSSPRAAVQ